jgi:uncharacterized protein YukE
MSEHIVVDFNLLANGAQSLKTQANALDGYIQDLISAVQPMEQTWVQTGNSAAAEAYEQAKAALMSATQDIVSTISSFGAAVDQAHQDQYANEMSIKASFS